MDSTISKIINKALDGQILGDSEIAALFKVEDLSEEAFAVQRAGRLFSEQTIAGKGEIHGQTGINVGPCSKDCQFCSFAVSNNVFPKAVKDPVQKVVDDVLTLEAAGCNAIYLMTTAVYPLNEFLTIGAAAKKALTTPTPLIANTGDFDEDGARALKDAGFDGVYHVIRLGEGVETKIPIERRWQSINAAHTAGLKLGACVEPVGPEHSIEELVEKTVFTREMGAVFSGAMRRTTLSASPLAKYGTVSYARMATIVAAVSLATGPDVPGNCTHEPNQLGVYNGANLLWAEVGSNPRDTEAETVRGWTGQNCRELFNECGWDVLEGPSRLFAS